MLLVLLYLLSLLCLPVRGKFVARVIGDLGLVGKKRGVCRRFDHPRSLPKSGRIGVMVRCTQIFFNFIV